MGYVICKLWSPVHSTPFNLRFLCFFRYWPTRWHCLNWNSQRIKFSHPGWNDGVGIDYSSHLFHNWCSGRYMCMQMVTFIVRGFTPCECAYRSVTVAIRIILCTLCALNSLILLLRMCLGFDNFWCFFFFSFFLIEFQTRIYDHHRQIWNGAVGFGFCVLSLLF